MRLVIDPVPFVLDAAGKAGLAAAVAPVQAPVAPVAVAVGADVYAFSVPHVAQRLALHIIIIISIQSSELRTGLPALAQEPMRCA